MQLLRSFFSLVMLVTISNVFCLEHLSGHKKPIDSTLSEHAAFKHGRQRHTSEYYAQKAERRKANKAARELVQMTNNINSDDETSGYESADSSDLNSPDSTKTSFRTSAAFSRFGNWASNYEASGSASECSLNDAASKYCEDNGYMPKKGYNSKNNSRSLISASIIILAAAYVYYKTDFVKQVFKRTDLKNLINKSKDKASKLFFNVVSNF